MAGDDNIDLNAETGKGEAVYELKLGAVLPCDELSWDYPQMWMEKQFKDNAANDDKVSRDEDAAIKMRMGDNVPEHFLQSVLEVRKGNVAMPPIGNACYSTPGCV